VGMSQTGRKVSQTGKELSQTGRKVSQTGKELSQTGRKVKDRQTNRQMGGQNA
jgi:hypothetical protein